MTERKDSEWIHLLKQEDEEAIAELWERLFQWALTVTRSRGQAEDLGRDAAVAAYQRIMQRGIFQYKFQCPFPGYCRTIVVKEVYRRMKPAPHLLDIDDPATPHPSAEVTLPIAGAKTIRQRLEPCMNELKPREHELIIMRYLQEMRPQAIAKQLGIRRNNVNQLLFRARDKLLNCLRRHEFTVSADLLAI